MSQVTSAQNPQGNGRHRADGGGTPVGVPYLPLTDDSAAAFAAAGDASVGSLVKDATTHMSTLVRAEIELAKSEVTRELKRAVMGSLFFIVALVVLLYSTFFFFFFLGELGWDIGLPRWASFLIVWGLMLVVAGFAGFLGFLKVRKIRAPQRTISTLKDTAAVLSSRGHEPAEGAESPANPYR